MLSTGSPKKTHQGATNVTYVPHQVSLDERKARMKQKGGILWLTGLSASGKSTLAIELERQLHEAGHFTYVLDGDNLRHGLNSDLGFSAADREENIRRVGEVAALMAEIGLIVISAFISPYRSDRQKAREAAHGQFREVWVQASLETCEKRDPKGLYKRARAGEIPDFTGISAPYEEPQQADLIVQTDTLSVEDSAKVLFDYAVKHFSINP